jgi:hypothetical protein
MGDVSSHRELTRIHLPSIDTVLLISPLDLPPSVYFTLPLSSPKSDTSRGIDHLQTYRAVSPLAIPFLGSRGEVYDLNGFAGYPERQGWNKSDIYETGAFRGRSRQEAEAFFQRWLFFGVLSEVLWVGRIKVICSHFICVDENGQEFISTEHLRAYLTEWTRLEARRQEAELESSEDRAARWESITVILGESHRWIQRFCAEHSETEGLRTNFVPEFWPTSPEISLSLLSMWASLNFAAHSIFQRLSHFRLYQGIHSSILSQHMLNCGWCENDLSKLRRHADITAQYFLSSFPPPRGTINHSRCVEYECLADQIEDANYQSIHNTPGCMCKHLGPSSEEIVSAIERGIVPLIKLTSQNNSTTYQLDVVERQTETHYVAISHVWSHGLGNVSSNSLPLCQLLKIQRAVNSLYNDECTVAFWIDTLCVPVQKDLQHIRKLAITNMNTTYRAADKVLVFDEFIQQGSTRAPWLERIARVSLASWQRRLWTLVEGKLATSLYYLFCDGSLSSEDVASPPPIAEGRTIPSELLMSMLDFSERALDGLNGATESQSHIEKFKAITRAIEHCNTSKTEDESICIATLLGVEPTALLHEHEPQRRMQHLYQSLGEIPTRILSQPGPRLSQQGYSWAPSSFLRRNNALGEIHRRSNCVDGVASISPDGSLRIRTPGYLLSQPRLPLRMHFFDRLFPYAIVRPTKRIGSENASIPDPESSWLGLRYYTDGSDRPVLYDSENLAVVCLTSTEEEDENPAVLVALLGAVVDRPNFTKRIRCRFVCRVGLGAMLPGTVRAFSEEHWRDHVQQVQMMGEKIIVAEWCLE